MQPFFLNLDFKVFRDKINILRFINSSTFTVKMVKILCNTHHMSVIEDLLFLECVVYSKNLFWNLQLIVLNLLQSNNVCSGLSLGLFPDLQSLDRSKLLDKHCLSCGMLGNF